MYKGQGYKLRGVQGAGVQATRGTRGRDTSYEGYKGQGYKLRGVQGAGVQATRGTRGRGTSYEGHTRSVIHLEGVCVPAKLVTFIRGKDGLVIRGRLHLAVKFNIDNDIEAVAVDSGPIDQFKWPCL